MGHAFRFYAIKRNRQYWTTLGSFPKEWRRLTTRHSCTGVFFARNGENSTILNSPPFWTAFLYVFPVQNGGGRNSVGTDEITDFAADFDQLALSPRLGKQYRAIKCHDFVHISPSYGSVHSSTSTPFFSIKWMQSVQATCDHSRQSCQWLASDGTCVILGREPPIQCHWNSCLTGFISPSIALDARFAIAKRSGSTGLALFCVQARIGSLPRAIALCCPLKLCTNRCRRCVPCHLCRSPQGWRTPLSRCRSLRCPSSPGWVRYRSLAS